MRAKKIDFRIDARTGIIQCYISSIRIGSIAFFPNDERGEFDAIIFLIGEEMFLHSEKAAKKWMQDCMNSLVTELAEEA